MQINLMQGLKCLAFPRGNFRMKLIKDLGTRLIKGTWVRYAIFKCPECLQEVERDMKAGIKAKSCGCKKNELIRISKTKHGESHSKLHTVWTTMKQRVLNPDATSYKDYGGRGITICPEWTNDYTNFRDWALDNGYKDSLTIDRKENNGNYCPENCHFVTSVIYSRCFSII